MKQKINKNHEPILDMSSKQIKVTQVPSCGTVASGCTIQGKEAGAIELELCESCRSFQMCCSDRGITHCFECHLYPCTKFQARNSKKKEMGEDLKFNQKLLEIMGEKHLKDYYSTKL